MSAIDVSDLRVTCDIKLGAPKRADSAKIVYSFEGEEGNLAFKSGDPPSIKTNGNIFYLPNRTEADYLTGDCALAVGFEGETVISRSALTTVVDYLSESCPGLPRGPTGAPLLLAVVSVVKSMRDRCYWGNEVI